MSQAGRIEVPYAIQAEAIRRLRKLPNALRTAVVVLPPRTAKPVPPTDIRAVETHIGAPPAVAPATIAQLRELLLARKQQRRPSL